MRNPRWVRDLQPYTAPNLTAPSERVVRDRTVYEALLGNVALSGQYAGPAVRAILAVGEMYGERDYALRLILARRRCILNDRTRTQRRWQANVSRRPLRGNHHDSWAAREKYVRCA